MRLASRLTCVVVGHRPEGGQATYDAAKESFVDVAKTQYSVCTRCGDVRPAPLDIVDGADDADEVRETDGAESDPTERSPTESNPEEPTRTVSQSGRTPPVADTQ